MNSFVENLIIENENLHVIAYKKSFVLAYEVENKKCYFTTKFYSSDQIGQMNEEYQNWANDILKKLNYSLNLINTQFEYYNTINLKK